MDLLDLQNLIEADAKYRFELRFDPSKGEEAWWVRAKLWDVRSLLLLSVNVRVYADFGLTVRLVAATTHAMRNV